MTVFYYLRALEAFRPPTLWVRVRVRVTLRLTISQSVCLGIEPNLGVSSKSIYEFDPYLTGNILRHDYKPPIG
jgi:hypothetical protein